MNRRPRPARPVDAPPGARRPVTFVDDGANAVNDAENLLNAVDEIEENDGDDHQMVESVEDGEEIMFIDSRVVRDTMQRHGHVPPPQPQQVQPAVRPPDPPQQPVSQHNNGIILDNFSVIDGKEAMNRIRLAIQGSGLPHFYVNPSSSTSAARQSLNNLFSDIENKLDHGVRSAVTLVKSTIARKSDIGDATKIDMNQSMLSPVIPGTLVVIVKQRTGIAFYTLDGSKLVPAPVDAIKDVERVAAALAGINYFAIFAGILTGDAKLVIVDCLNFGGVDISKNPYAFRLQRVHALASVFPDDNVSVIPVSSSPKKFLEARNRDKQAFLALRSDHSHDQEEVLISTFKFADPKDTSAPDSVVYRWDIPENLGDEVAIKPGTPAADKPAIQIAGKKVCISGGIPGTTKAFVEGRVREMGGTVVDRVVQPIADILFMGANPSADIIDVARKNNIPTYPATELMKIIKK